ncbi:hypothetical protein BDW_08295 [Bdellovibrio bacteriovorus W]|nr:hypothetical protein BDW_08295 [Bdellovibrio bacteriovorus W]
MKTILTSLILGLSQFAFAHGEEAPGPHGGHIRMPGAFHTELNLDKKNEAHIYLLDMNFQNPTQTNSKVEMEYRSGKSKTAFKCGTMGKDHFHCKPEKALKGKGELVITATREGAPGNEAIYPFPLPKWPEGTKPAESHHHH